MPSAQPTTTDQPDPAGSDDPEPSRPESPAPDPQPPLAIQLVLHTAEPDPPITAWLDAQLRRAAELEGITHAQISVVVVADDEMAQMHTQYTGVAGTTDVLTFDLRDDPAATNQPIEADIVVCLDEATRQATKRNHPVRHELLLYAIHGLMHLLGEDDHDQDDYQRMHAREDTLLQRMGFAPLFDPGREPG